MTRKDYITLASALRRARHEYSAGYVQNQWEDCVSYVADVLQEDNPNFKRKVFIDACYRKEE